MSIKEYTTLQEVVDIGEKENGNIEFKHRLRKNHHLKNEHKSSLAAQLKHRLLSGDGEALYVIGVTDDGDITGIQQDYFSESVDVLSVLCADVGAKINNVETQHINSGLVGIVEIIDADNTKIDDTHLVIGTAGHVDHGKSTLVGALISGELDDGSGKLREDIENHPHEIERGLSSSLSHTVYGFHDNETLHLSDPSRTSEKAELVEKSDKIISFVDTVGHESWLKTTIRGLLGQQVDYGLLTVAADDGMTKISREHFGILLGANIPTIVTITKSDIASEDEMKNTTRSIERHIRDVGKIPIRVDEIGVEQSVEELQSNSSVIPIVKTSSVTGMGIEKLNSMFRLLQKRHTKSDVFKLYIDKVYDIKGIGGVVTGTVKSGSISVGETVIVGPTKSGNYIETEVRGIEMHYHKTETATEGQIIGIDLKNVDKEDLHRGMVVMKDKENAKSVKKFTAEVVVLNHPTRIQNGYEPVLHMDTISEIVTLNPKDCDTLLPGETGLVEIEFKANTHHIEKSQQFLFREGATKGIGKVVDIEEN